MNGEILKGSLDVAKGNRTKGQRGFACLTPEQRREAARIGALAKHQKDREMRERLRILESQQPQTKAA